jgi:hypothetical protein
VRSPRIGGLTCLTSYGARGADYPGQQYVDPPYKYLYHLFMKLNCIVEVFILLRLEVLLPIGSSSIAISDGALPWVCDGSVPLP